MRKIIVLLAVLFVAFQSTAQNVNNHPITIDEAEQIAASFFDHIGGKKSNSAKRQAKGLYDKPVLAYKAGTEQDVSFYVFNNTTEGFVLIGGKSDMPSILGYSYTGAFDYDKAPGNFLWWMKQYESSGTLKKTSSDQTKHSIEPLLTTRWGQNEPFNNAIPSLGPNYKAFPTGCTATAMSQVMKYYEHPQHGIGSNSYSITYNGSNTLNFYADFANTIYDWNNMLDHYSTDYNQAQANAVSTLMYHVGVAENTRYGSGGSSASSHDGALAMINNFDYDKSMKKTARLYYTDDEWCQLIYDELLNSRPIIYSAEKSNEGVTIGHSFVIHGYDMENDLYAINWGWSGYCDGFFSLIGQNPLNPYQPESISKTRMGVIKRDISIQQCTDYTDVTYSDNDDECNRTPSLKYDIWDSQEQYKHLKGVCCDGISQVKIFLQNGSYLPETKCGYTYKWSLNEDIGKLSNTDNPKEVTYTAPDVFPGKDNESIYTVKAIIHYSNGDPAKEGYQEVPIQISRVPLVLVHGLNANGGTWLSFEKYLINKGAYRRNIIRRADYSEHNCSQFVVNRLVVSDNINMVKKYALVEGFIATKCDVIGHSMGGILSRLHIQYNNGSTNVNKLITVNTPHSGSPLGDVFGKWEKVPTFKSTDAIKDLALNSSAIDNYLNSPTNLSKAVGVPIHAVETEYTGGYSLSYTNWLTALNAICVNSGIHMFYNDINDGVVSVTSQRGGCNRYSHFKGLNHCASPNNGNVHSKLYDLLKSPNKSAEFSRGGFYPIDLSYQSAKARSAQIKSMKSSGSSIIIERENSTIKVSFTNSADFDNFSSIVSFGDDSLQVFTVPTFTCSIPKTFSGKIEVFSILSSDDGNYSYLTNNIDVVTPLLSPQRLEVVSLDDPILIGDITPITLACTWSNDSTTYVKPDYIEENDGIFTYNDGLLNAKAEGGSNVRFYFNNLSCNAYLSVSSRGELSLVTSGDKYHGNFLDEPGYNSNQTIFYNIKPNEGGTYVCQIVSRDGIEMATYNGTKLSKKVIDRKKDNKDEQLKFYYTPMNGGLNNAKFNYGVIVKNLINGAIYYQKGGSTDNLSSSQLDPGYYFSSPVTTTIKTDMIPYTGTYAVYPAFSIDAGNTWNEMKFDISKNVPIIEIVGGENPEKINLPISVSQSEIQLGKTAKFFFSDYYSGQIQYTSSDNRIAEVTYDGTIITNHIGIASIKVEISGDDNYLPEEKYFTIYVVEHKMNPLLMAVPSCKLKVGESTNILIPNNYRGNISYTTSPSNVLRILSDGTIEALSSGVATIQAISSKDEDYYETVNTFTIEVIEDELEMQEELSIKKMPTIGIDNVISDNNSTMSVMVYNNTNNYINNATLYYSIHLDKGRKSNWHVKADLPASTGYTLNHDLLTLKEYMTPGTQYTCYFYKDAQYSIPMNLPSVSFTYGESCNIDVKIDDSNYSTVSLPFDANIPHGMKAYTIGAFYENSIVLSEASFLSKHNSYIICGLPKTYSFSGILYPVNQNPQSGFMIGLHNNTIIPKNNYYVDDNSGNLMKTSVDRPASRWSAYATLPQGAAATISLNNDNPSGIEEIINCSMDSNVFGIYTVDGKKIPFFQNGVNIIKYSNGTIRKVFLR